MATELTYWFCIIGPTTHDKLPDGCDIPLRRAVHVQFERVTGHAAAVCSSGWCISERKRHAMLAANRQIEEDESGEGVVTEPGRYIVRDARGHHSMIDVFCFCGEPWWRFLNTCRVQPPIEMPEILGRIDGPCDCTSPGTPLAETTKDIISVAEAKLDEWEPKLPLSPDPIEVLRELQWQEMSGRPGTSAYPTCIGCGVQSYGSLSTQPHGPDCLVEAVLNPKQATG